MWTTKDGASLTTQLADFKSHIRIVLSSEPDKKTSSTGDMDSVMTLDEIQPIQNTRPSTLFRCHTFAHDQENSGCIYCHGETESEWYLEAEFQRKVYESVDATVNLG
jgi:hypothetical protein